MARRAQLALVDLSGMFWARWYACGGDGAEVSDSVASAIGAIQARASHVLVCADDHKRSWRKLYYPPYKANRPPKPPGSMRVLAAMERRFNALVWSGFEADDVIADLARAPEVGVDIHSADKDLYQLIDDQRRVAVLPGNGVRVDEFACWEKFGVLPYQIPSWLTLVGDSSDNLPGVPGFGKKRAAEVLHEYGTLTAFECAPVSELFKRFRWYSADFDAKAHSTGRSLRTQVHALAKLGDPWIVSFAERLLAGEKPKTKH